MPNYIPKTIDTSEIRLGSDLAELVERLAENNHDHWATRRFTEGWSYGSERDDSKKENPDLLPYSELPDSEKEYDRTTIIEVIKALMALGYEVKRK